ncbi:hypothetical protein SEPCBS119000_001046 [Sporothrix epigloea]|uniref:Uncharacterized protein n=1 Tax=Sporothrix epigloea TaxID=1892477 RepID=A0ABP0DBG3_9PEZI
MSGPAPASSQHNSSTVGGLLAGIATALQDTLRILLFADKRGWGPDEFEQVRAVEEALDEAKRDFQAFGPLVNGQFYYENDRRPESLAELAALGNHFAEHTQLFRDWIRSGGPINPLWVRETVRLRRQLHRAQCRAACRIFRALHEFGDSSSSGARCLGAFLVHRRLRMQTEYRRTQAKVQTQGRPENPVNINNQFGRTATMSQPPARRQQQSHPSAQEYWQRQRQLVDRGRFPVRTGYKDDAHEPISLEMTSQTVQPPQSAPDSRPLLNPISKASPTAPQLAQQPSSYMQRASSQQLAPRDGISLSIHLPTSSSASVPIAPALTSPFEPARTTIPLHPDEPPSPPPRLPSLEDLVPYCNAVGSFERFGDRDIAFICDYCDGHIIWKDVQRLPTTRAPPAANSASTRNFISTSSSPPSSYLPFSVSAPGAPNTLRQSLPLNLSAETQSAARPTQDDDNDGDYPRWQASTVAMSDTSVPRTVVFAPLAIANHLAPMAGAWEARLWCPYCDTYLYYDSAEGDQTKYAQDEHGFPTLADFQLHLEWHHTGLSMPALPSASSNCSVM